MTFKSNTRRGPLKARFFKNTIFSFRYEYSFTSNRLWRKNRRKNRGLSSLLLSLCDGVDLNRNFGYHWSDANPFAIQSSTQITCAETYSGPGPFSEPESANIRDFVTSIQQNVVVSQIQLDFFNTIIYLGDNLQFAPHDRIFVQSTAENRCSKLC